MAALESWQAVQLEALGAITSHLVGAVSSVVVLPARYGFCATVPKGPRSCLYELFTWQALQLMPTPGQATSAA